MSVPGWEYTMNKFLWMKSVTTHSGVMAIAILMSSLAITSVVAQAQQVGLSTSTSDSVQAPGDLFDVEISLENLDQMSIQGIQHVISWDAATLQLLSVTLPDAIPSAPPILAMAWNAPPPAGPGGDIGCTQWWDGQGTEAFSLGLVLDGEFTGSSATLAILHMRVNSFATTGESVLTAPVPDLACGWLGPLTTDPAGDVLPTISNTLTLTISDVPPPIAFTCAEAAGTAYLSWQDGGAYDSVQIERDGVIIGEVAGSTELFEDSGLLIPSEAHYRIRGVSGTTPSVATECTVAIDGAVEQPAGISCIQSGSGVLLGWQNTLPYQVIMITRDGDPLATIAGTASSYLDSGIGLEGLIEYGVIGSLGSQDSQPATCQVDIEPPDPSVVFIRGDTTSDGQLDLSDGVITLQYLFLGGEIPCASAADHDDSGSLDLGDAISLLSFLFIAGPQPAPPFPLPGIDPTADSLPCAVPCTDPACYANTQGDECESAPLVGMGDTIFDTTSMTTSTDLFTVGQCSDSLLGDVEQDIWLSFVAPASGQATFSLCDQVSFDSDIVVYEGFCRSMIQIGCNGDGDGCANFTSELSNVLVSEGASYLIRIGGWGSLEYGSGTLTITID